MACVQARIVPGASRLGRAGIFEDFKLKYKEDHLVVQWIRRGARLRVGSGRVRKKLAIVGAIRG